MLTLYKFFCLINYPLWVIALHVRKLKGKEHKLRFIEKLGYYKKTSPKNEVIWINSLGLGETLSLTYFLEQLSKKFPDKTLLVTSSTLQSQIAFENIPLSKNIIHQYAPIDNYSALKRFFNHWDPTMALFSELDIWPLRVSEVKKRKIPLLLINSRMNERKKRARKWLGTSFSETIKLFDHIFLQDESSRLHFIHFGVDERKITIHGPLKVAGTIFPNTNFIEKKFRTLLKDKLIWTAASLHESEEIEILEAYKMAKRDLPNLVLIMIPRSIELSKNTKRKSLRYSNITLHRVEEGDMPNRKTDIIVVGRVGELGLWYKLAFISFIGNSLDLKKIKTGKNPYEAVQAKSVVIHGPKMLEPGYEKLSALGISDIVLDRYDISKAIKKYSDFNIRLTKIKNGNDLLIKNKGMVKLVIDDVESWYKKKGGNRPPFS